MQRCRPLFLGIYKPCIVHVPAAYWLKMNHIGHSTRADWERRHGMHSALCAQCAYCKMWFPNRGAWWGKEDDSGYWYWRWGPPRLHLHDHWTPTMGTVGWMEHTWVWRRWHGWWYCNWCWNDWQRWHERQWILWRQYCVQMAEGAAPASAFPWDALPPP